MVLLFSPTLTLYLRGFIICPVELLIRKLTMKIMLFKDLNFLNWKTRNGKPVRHTLLAAMQRAKFKSGGV